MEVNWSKIKELCPNAVNSLIVYEKLKNNRDLELDEENNKLYTDKEALIKYNLRNLYDFFFEKGLVVDVSWLPIESKFVWNVFTLTDEMPLVVEENPEENWEANRKSAELYAFLKSFMILENIYLS